MLRSLTGKSTQQHITIVITTDLPAKTQFGTSSRAIDGKQYLYYIHNLSFMNYLYSGFSYGIGYKLENLIYLELRRAGYEVYVGAMKDKEVDFVAKKPTGQKIKLKAETSAK